MTIDDDLRNSLLLAMSEVHSGNGKEGQAILEAILTALEAKGLVIEQGWQPIETAPKDGTRYIGYQGTSGDYEGQTDVCWYSLECHHNGVLSFFPTHWRPLPEPPARGEG